MSTQPNELRDLSREEMRDQVLLIAKEVAGDAYKSALADCVFHQFNKAKGGDELDVLEELSHGEMYSLLLYLRYRKDKRTHGDIQRATVTAFE